jgi:hypothetical protein
MHPFTLPRRLRPLAAGLFLALGPAAQAENWIWEPLKLGITNKSSETWRLTMEDYALHTGWEPGLVPTSRNKEGGAAQPNGPQVAN